MKKSVLKGKSYQLDPLGNPIFDKSSAAPKLVDNDVGKVPILGMPLFSFANRDYSLSATAQSDELWQIFSAMITYQASYNKDG
jgi:hypothetical protein